MASYTHILREVFRDPALTRDKSVRWDPTKQMKSLSGKVVVLTGPNSGIGYETLRQLVLSDAKVYLFGRSLAKMEAAKKAIHDECVASLANDYADGDLRFNGKVGEMVLVQCDLASLESIQRAAKQFMAMEDHVDLFFGNAGVMIGGQTAEGYELMLGTNVLGHHALIRLLLPALRRAAQQSNSVETGETRVVLTSSGSHNWVDKPVHMSSAGLDDVTKTGMNLFHLYGRSKLGNIYTARKLAQIFADNGDGVVVCSVHPGGVKSQLGSENKLLTRIKNLFLDPANLGAVTQLWGAVGAEKNAVDGKYLVPWARVGEESQLAQNDAVRDELWAWCEQQCIKHGLVDKAIP
ncbi:NAD(P)-binding protein [Testicularia cyperi]|uniref:NAD(P)-binding protein n=1 Tax=Testicularia cyperi TaxID=1882483 RepID=A0A317XRK5_9BASI|nr:NAD(P)-binding protein [Testicularia cyperi]